MSRGLRAVLSKTGLFEMWDSTALHPEPFVASRAIGQGSRNPTSQKRDVGHPWSVTGKDPKAAQFSRSLSSPFGEVFPFSPLAVCVGRTGLVCLYRRPYLDCIASSSLRWFATSLNRI